MADVTPLTIREPDSSPKGGVVVVQEAFGVNDHIVDVAGRFAAEGFLAVVPHVFHRTGDPVLPYDDMSQIIPHFTALTADGILADVDAALAHLAEAGSALAQTGVVAFCMGGTVALAVATRRYVGAAFTCYGGGLGTGRFGCGPLIGEAPRLRAPWLGLFGNLDEGIPVDDVERLRAAAVSSGQATEVVRYADAGHGFHCDQRESYHEPSARDAWSRTIAFFDEHLTPAGA